MPVWLGSLVQSAAFKTMLTRVLSVGMVVGPVLTFLPQYLDIRASENADGFSPYICLILLVSNIVRVFFWLQKRFQIPLLLQSLVMIVGQLCLLDVIVSVKLRQRPDLPYASNYSFHSRRLIPLAVSTSWATFWKWPFFSDYVAFLGVVVGVVGLATATNLLLLQSSLTMEAMGLFALLLESTLAMPQAYQNWQSGSVRGLRQDMILMWLVGDVAKTAYFVATRAPMQFLLCGLIQMSVDVVILAQCWRYPSQRHMAPMRLQPFDVVVPPKPFGSNATSPV